MDEQNSEYGVEKISDDLKGELLTKGELPTDDGFSKKKIVNFTDGSADELMQWKNSLEWQSLSLFCNRVKCMRNVHDEMAKKLYLWTHIMVFSAAFITFLASVFSLIASSSYEDTGKGLTVFVAILTIVSTILQVLASTLNWRGRAQEHNHAYMEYLKLYNELVAALKGLIRDELKGDARKYVFLIRERINQIESAVSCPPDSDRLVHWRAYYSGTKWKERTQKRQMDYKRRITQYGSELGDTEEDPLCDIDENKAGKMF